MPSLSRRRVVTAAGMLLAGWLALTFARQVGEATAASNRADELRAANAALRDEVARLQTDLDRVRDPAYVLLEGRAFGLGGRGEIPFALGPDAPALGPEAPGSAAVRLGAEADPGTPLDAWLAALFGPGR
jgi:cell division protein FtsB